MTIVYHRTIDVPIFLVMCFVTLSGVKPAYADRCGNLVNLKLANTQITSSETISGGAPSLPPSIPPAVLKGLPSFCRVMAEIQPVKDSDIKVEVWMPSSGWNGMLTGRGNGGFAGAINYGEMSYGVRNGYAAVSTDTGHSGSSSDADWATGHPERIIDYGYRAIHEMTAKAKLIVAAFYGNAPHYSYFDSCSNGGRQALMEAQRFPEDYDGIIAGAPAINLTHIAAGFLWDMQALYANSASQIPPSKLPLIHSAFIRVCDGQDGVKDGDITDPGACHFDPTVLLCKGADSDSCLTDSQIEALKKVYSGMRDAQGKMVYPGFEPGGELGPMGWVAWLDAPSIEQNIQYSLGVAFYRNMVYDDPKWDYRSFRVDRDVEVADEKLGRILDATDPDLKAFADRGGKLILYQGWNDAAIAPLNMIDYYNSVIAATPTKSDSFIRLYMVPGFQHCWGGEGAVDFEVISSLRRWVESGVAPSSILAREHKNPADTSSEIIMTRPLCPYPQRPYYKGIGDTSNAVNFECK
jgi:Tannase and feruloyl esterase